HVVPGSDRRSLGPLARGLLAFASGDDAARELNDFFRIVAAHCRPRRASRFLLTCALFLTAASPAFAARSMALDAMGRAARKSHHRRRNKAMELPHATAERLEQIPRRSRTRRNIDCGDRDEPVKLAGRRYCAGS